jgi:hypothetical protein
LGATLQQIQECLSKWPICGDMFNIGAFAGSTGIGYWAVDLI